jgi:carboxylate-amine ligase
MLLGEQVKPEMIQSMIEVCTGICTNVQEARTDITKLRGIVATLVREKGLEIVAAGTHPFSRWQDQKVFEARYELIIEENQVIARSLLTFGLHVHKLSFRCYYQHM